MQCTRNTETILHQVLLRRKACLAQYGLHWSSSAKSVLLYGLRWCVRRPIEILQMESARSKVGKPSNWKGPPSPPRFYSLQQNYLLNCTLSYTKPWARKANLGRIWGKQQGQCTVVAVPDRSTHGQLNRHTDTHKCDNSLLGKGKHGWSWQGTPYQQLGIVSQICKHTAVMHTHTEW